VSQRSGLQRWILGGLVLGLAAGLAANRLVAKEILEPAVKDYIEPLGKIFLRLLFMTVLPLVFSCLTLGIRELGDLRQLGRIGLKTLIFTLLLSGISVGIGLGLVNTIGPGRNLPAGVQAELKAVVEKEKAEVDKRVASAAAATGDKSTLQVIVEAAIPQNPVQSAARAFEGDMLGVMCFALLFGIALGACGSARTGPLVGFLEGLYDVSLWLVGLAMRLAPLGVAALVFSTAARLGFGVVSTLGTYVLTVLLGLALHQLVVYPLVLALACKVSPLAFFSRIRPVMVTAFSTSSSNATLPTTIQVAQERLGIPPKIANFVLTLGSTFNQNGTALFEGVTVIFLAQFYGVELSVTQQLLVLTMSVLAGVGTAGVPGGSIPLIVPVLTQVGVPGQGIAMILGVDRILDMCRTVLNVTGDLVAATFVARGERREEADPSRQSAA
jgi:DAACS family dicarboxylate/amino acid:cation (Na+ or H+) symporter